MPQEDIRGLKDLVHIPYPLYVKILAVLLAFALAWGLFLLSKKRVRKKPRPAPPEPAIPLHERILRDLSQLRAGAGETAGDLKTFHFRLSEIFRTYLEGRFLIPATDSTTEEILKKWAGSAPLPDAQKDAVVRILKETDEVKFADRLRTRSEADALAALAENFVRETAHAPRGGPA